jgi:predicted dehydrogenase
MPKTYRVAVIGRTGKGNYGHGLDVVWKALDNVEVVAVADEDEKGRAAAAQRLGAKSAYADYRQMLDKERPQLVSVADRWLDAHRDMVVACARAGASVLLEKPMARTLEEADEMVRACETHHVKLAIAHQTRYSPRLKVVRDLIGDGKLGELLELRGRGKEDGRGGGQDLMVLGTHVFDLM